jgi:hypothetical protein
MAKASAKSFSEFAWNNKQFIPTLSSSPSSGGLERIVSPREKALPANH